MNHAKLTTLILAASLAVPAAASRSAGFGLEVVVDGRPRPELHGRGAVYVEALRGREYILRLTNPLPYRVAVALSVDGLNTIDARHGDAQTARKWVLGPYETVEIAGWQVNGAEARRFYFTGERSSYGAWLGETENLGVIEAVFFRERVAPRPVVTPRWDGAVGEPLPSAPAPRAAPHAGAEARPEAAAKAAPADEYAATGIGERTEHRVHQVRLDLEATPAAVVRLRYEFRPQLVALGLLPPPGRPSALDRREGARGFAGGYCPDPR